jgi:hypothetical protein
MQICDVTHGAKLWKKVARIDILGGETYTVPMIREYRKALGLIRNESSICENRDAVTVPIEG